jgi:hypothetical protein
MGVTKRIKRWLRKLRGTSGGTALPDGYKTADELRADTKTHRKRWGDKYDDRLKPNNTDYDLPMGWSQMSDEDKCLWFTWERTARMAKRQDTAWGRGYDVRRRDSERTSSDQYRVDDDDKL